MKTQFPNTKLRKTSVHCLLPSIVTLTSLLWLSTASADVRSSAKQVERPRAPNVIVILTDDLGYADVGFNGSKDIHTPNIDRIANEGARFERGYVTFPVSGPSRAGLLTGRYQSRFGFDLNPSENPSDPRAGLPLTEKTIAQIIKPAGYVSSIIGKWHMGNHPTFHPLQRGFNEFFGFTNGGHDYFTDKLLDIDPLKAKNDAQLYRTRLIRNQQSEKTSGYLTDILSDEAVNFVQRESGKSPFFLYLAYNAPHVPLQAPAKYTDRFKHISDPMRRTYAGMISAVDDGVGRVLDKLDELGVANDTIVFFLSDNGGPLTRAKNGSSNFPFRGGKGDLFEGGVRVPFAMKWPSQVPAGLNYPHAVSALDILATIVGVNAIDMSKNNPIDGVNLIPFLQDKNFSLTPHKALYWRYNSESLGEKPVQTAIVEGDKKLLRVKQQHHLIDMNSDKSESNNLFDKEHRKTSELDSKFLKWNSQMSTSRIAIFNEWSESSEVDIDKKTEEPKTKPSTSKLK